HRVVVPVPRRGALSRLVFVQAPPLEHVGVRTRPKRIAEIRPAPRRPGVELAGVLPVGDARGVVLGREPLVGPVVVHDQALLRVGVGRAGSPPAETGAGHSLRRLWLQPSAASCAGVEALGTLIVRASIRFIASRRLLPALGCSSWTISATCCLISPTSGHKSAFYSLTSLTVTSTL